MFNLLAFQVLSARGRPTEWFHYMRSSGTDKEKRKKGRILFTSWWQIWKERNRRIFDHKEASVLQVSSFIQEAIQIQGMAWSRD
jgi:hypothetical protein